MPPPRPVLRLEDSARPPASSPPVNPGCVSPRRDSRFVPRQLSHPSPNPRFPSKLRPPRSPGRLSPLAASFATSFCTWLSSSASPPAPPAPLMLKESSLAMATGSFRRRLPPQLSRPPPPPPHWRRPPPPQRRRRRQRGCCCPAPSGASRTGRLRRRRRRWPTGSSPPPHLARTRRRRRSRSGAYRRCVGPSHGGGAPCRPYRVGRVGRGRGDRPGAAGVRPTDGRPPPSPSAPNLSPSRRGGGLPVGGALRRRRPSSGRHCGRCAKTLPAAGVGRRRSTASVTGPPASRRARSRMSPPGTGRGHPRPTLRLSVGALGVGRPLCCHPCSPT